MLLLPNKFLLLNYYIMKKLLFIILTWIFFCSSIVMTLLYVNTKKDYQSSLTIWIDLVRALWNATDYTLCIEDVYLWNTNLRFCENYLNWFVEDIKFYRENLSMKTNYNYIGE
jgi:hypothetical protein